MLNNNLLPQNLPYCLQNLKDAWNLRVVEVAFALRVLGLRGVLECPLHCPGALNLRRTPLHNVSQSLVSSELWQVLHKLDSKDPA